MATDITALPPASSKAPLRPADRVASGDQLGYEDVGLRVYVDDNDQLVRDATNLWPPQGQWTDEDFRAVCWPGDTELIDGYVEFGEMPSVTHQDILIVLLEILQNHFGKRRVHFGPLRLQIRRRKAREPDLFVIPESVDRSAHEVDAAALCVEIVSPGGEGSDNWERDYREKRSDYAEAGVPEYWIVDPQERIIIVLTLVDGAYDDAGRYGVSEKAKSANYEGLSVDSAALFEGASG